MPGPSSGMEKKVRKKGASFIGVGVVSAGAKAVLRGQEATVECISPTRRMSQIMDGVLDEEVDCISESRASSGRLYQESCTVEDRSNGDDPVCLTSEDGSVGIQDLSAGNSVQVLSNTCTGRKRKRRRVEDELFRSHESNGKLEVPSSLLDEVARSVQRNRVQDDVGKARQIGENQEEQTPKRSEEDRVWQYVCKRSLYISPPTPARQTEEQNVWHPSRPDGNLFVGKTNVTVLTIDRDVVKVTLTRESQEVRNWIERQSAQRFGLDLEWQPNRLKGRKENKVSLLQLSTESECLLVQMLHLDSIPDELVQLLKDPNQIIAGVGISNDAKKLKRDHGLVCQGEVELTTLAVACFKDQELKKVGLKALAKKVLQFDMNKSKRITMSNWAKLHLSRSQVEYASLDAWVSLAIYSKLDKVSGLVTA